jgi:hypothetical protein
MINLALERKAATRLKEEQEMAAATLIRNVV